MLSTQIVDSDAFLDMPISSQNLYFHLVMRADDEGFIGNSKKIMRMVSAGDDDFKVLLSKRFILIFDSGVIVIKHWLIHNAIRMDRLNPTSYQEEKKLLITKENKAYTEWQPNGNQMTTIGHPKLSKVKLSEVNTATEVAPIPIKKKRNSEDLMNCIEFVKWCRESTQKHIQVIGEWAEAENPNHTTYGEWQSFIKRNLRAAQNLTAFDIKKIEKAYQLMLKDVVQTIKGKKVGFITKYSLETVGKYIDLV